MYTGKKIDPDTGLYYFNARWYDASLGKFITEDPIKDGVNWYVYCANNPLRYIDPTGLELENIIRGFKATWDAIKELPSSTARGLSLSWEETKKLPASTKKGIKDSIPGLRDAASAVIQTQADVFGDLYTLGTQIGGYDPISGKEIDASGGDIAITSAAILIAGVSAKTADMVMTSKKAVREMADVSGDVVEAAVDANKAVDNTKITLWRAVEDAELEDILKYGDYNIDNNSTYKRFCRNEADVDNFINVQPDRNYTKTNIEVSMETVNKMDVHADLRAANTAYGVDVDLNPEFYDEFDKVNIVY